VELVVDDPEELGAAAGAAEGAAAGAVEGPSDLASELLLSEPLLSPEEEDSDDGSLLLPA
jgi:hypothetical protein